MDAEILTPRAVPLGGPRAMTVRRTLPARGRTTIGAWCFADHYGPDQVASTGGMRVPPHPHTGLATVSWLFTGEIEHRDSAGHHAFVRPGELNLMTAGRGISHSEVSTPASPLLHGAQLWIALPARARAADPAFERYVAPTVGPAGGLVARVFLGSLLGSASPVPTHSAIVGAELVLEAGARATVPVENGFEHGVLVDAGSVDVDGVAAGSGDLVYLPRGRSALELAADAGSPARVLLLGGEPFGEKIVMWWNFIGRTHDEIVDFRNAWQAGHAGFGLPANDPLPPLPAPPLPPVRLRAR